MVVDTTPPAARPPLSRRAPRCRSKNNPEVLERRRQRVAQLDSQVADMTANNPGRVPAWEEARLMAMDRLALEQGKRCVMWDDQGAGFYLVRTQQRTTSYIHPASRRAAS